MGTLGGRRLTTSQYGHRSSDFNKQNSMNLIFWFHRVLTPKSLIWILLPMVFHVRGHFRRTMSIKSHDVPCIPCLTHPKEKDLMKSLLICESLTNLIMLYFEVQPWTKEGARLSTPLGWLLRWPRRPWKALRAWWKNLKGALALLCHPARKLNKALLKIISPKLGLNKALLFPGRLHREGPFEFPWAMVTPY